MKPKLLRFIPVWVFLLLLLSIFSTNAFSQDIIALQKMKNYVSENKQRLGLSTEDLSTLHLTHEYTDASTGIHHMYAAQKINGLTVTNAGFALHSAGTKNVEANQLVATKSYSIKPLNVVVTSSQAVMNLMAGINYKSDSKIELKQAAQGTDQVTVYRRNESPIWDIPCRLVYYNNVRLSTLQPAWEVQMMDLYKKHYWLAYIDASTGKILERRDLILHCSFGGAETDQHAVYHASHKHNFVEAGSSAAVKQNAPTTEANRYFAIIPNSYRVYDLPLESPGDTVQQSAPHALSTRSGDTLASPDGWHRTNGNPVPYQYTRGNNVFAFQDPSPTPLGGFVNPSPTNSAYNNGGPGGTPSATEPFLFDYPVDLTKDPADYRLGAVVNLFYWNNLMHDVFYHLGFTEAAGNFQESPTFSTGTRPGGNVANDAVLAQAQDGGGTNNANFLTTPDGTPGQMQMYLWTAAFPDSLVQITSSSSGVPPGGSKYLAVQGSFNALPTTNNSLYDTAAVVNKQFVIVQKNPLSTVGTETQGCATGQQSIALPPGNNVQDKIVLIDRGNCSFVEKILGAQAGGAAGVIIINNVPGPPAAMGGSDAPGNVINIPAVMVSKDDGDFLKAQIQAGANIIGSLRRDAPPPPRRDGDLDNGVIAHEYGHGISNRLTGPNTVGPLGGDEQGGEGWSDFMALYMTMRTNDLLPAAPGHPNGVLPTRSIGNYVTYQQAEGRGIRPTPYSLNTSVNPSTYKDIGKGGEISIPHGVGYIWCTMMYEMLQGFIDQYGMGNEIYEGANPTADSMPPATAKGNNIAMRLIVEGMKLQGTSPTFVRQRDAIIKADSMLYKGQHVCSIIWPAFARRGLGASATSGTNGVGDEFEAYDVPLTCNPNQKRVSIVKNGPVKLNNGQPVTYTINVTNKYPVPVTGVLVTDTLPAGLSFTSASDNPVLNGNTVTWTINLAGNETKALTLTTQLSSGTSSMENFGDDHEASATKWIAENNGGLTTWTYSNNASQAYSGSKYWFAANTGTPPGTNTTLRTANLINVPANAELVFIHKFATEAEYDGGVVEVMEEDSLMWKYIPPNKFVKGGYNGIITNTNNPLIGTASMAAFTGASPGYIVSVARLDDFVGKNISIRFRFTCDQTGGTVAGGGWWMDDVYVLVNRTEIVNTANAITNIADPILRETEGTNAKYTSSAFILGGTALPSNLGALSAVVARQSVNLSWKTFNETNTSSFDIERKGLGEVNFAKIGSVAPAARGTQTRSYTFNDPNVSAGNKYQYRVRQVNRGGEGYHSNVVVVNLSGKSFAADVYPNPAKNVANLSIVNPGGGKVTINMFDVLGKKIATFIGAEAQSQVIPLPVTGLKAGTYWIEVNTNENRTTLKLVIDK